jgi:hypothetical protein
MPSVTTPATRPNAAAAKPFAALVIHLPRILAFAAILSVVSAVAAPAGSASGTPETCGLPIAIQDPDIRLAFVRFDRNQSPGAAKACAYARTAMAAGLRPWGETR